MLVTLPALLAKLAVEISIKTPFSISYSERYNSAILKPRKLARRIRHTARNQAGT